MNCLIVDDNPIARTTLRQLVSRDPQLVLVGECSDAMEAYQAIRDVPVDLLLLDIEMGDMSGIDLVKSLTNKHLIVIFITSKREYAAEAFDLNVADYLTKPITPARFLQALEKAWEIFRAKLQEVRTVDDSFLFIRDSNIIRKLKIEDILYVEAMGDYVKLFTKDKFYAVHTSMKEVENKLSQTYFLRVHRSFIIQVGKIDSIEGGTLIINKKMIPVADSYRSILNQRLNVL